MDTDTLDLPLKYKIRIPENKKNNAPSIFFLHGYGSNMNDLFALNQFFSDDWACISLQGPIPTGFGGWSWAEIDYNNIKELPKPEQRISSRDDIIGSIKMCIDSLDLDPAKVHLAGFSQGAAFTLFCGLTNPKLFNGLGALCGFLEYKKIQSEINHDIIKQLNIFVANGLVDEIIPIKLGKLTYKGLRNLGVKPLYKEYDMGHTISNDCLKDFIKWINSIQ